MSVISSSVTGGRARTLGIAFALLVGAIFLALVVPVVQEARMTRECSGLGGSLAQSMEKVEPLVVGRTVYRCIGPGGQVLKNWY